jgi:predicted metal-dependent phosphotriesterase family hydrolase
MIPRGIVRSVLGDTVPGAGKGTALIHEHISSDLSQRSGPAFLLNDLDLAVSEISAAESDGVALIVDNGNTGHRRDPLFLLHCAQRTGVCIIASTGHYLDRFYPPCVFQSSAEEIAAGMVEDLTAGIGGGPVRAGAIAEIGLSGDEPTPAEERVLFAAGLAQAETDAPLLTHTTEGQGWQRQLDLIASAGADPGRVVIGHMDCAQDRGAHRAIIKRGAWLGFDRVGLLKYEIATRERYRSSGGSGYAGMLTTFVPRLAAAGMDDAAITMLVRENPWRFLLGR